MTITKPSGVVSGDVMVFFWWTTDSALLVGDPGWNTNFVHAVTLDGDSHRAEVHTKVAGGSEPANYTWNIGAGTGQKLGVILAYRYVHATQPSVSAGSTLGVTTGTHVQPAITPLQGNSMLVYAWMFNRDGGGAFSLGSISGSPGGMTQRFFQDFSSVSRQDLGVAVYDEIWPPIGPTGMRSLTTTNTDVSSVGLQAVIRAQGT